MYKPIFIAGPCVIETFDILEEVAKELVRLNNKYGINIIFKSSFDKANRTSLHSYRNTRLVFAFGNMTVAVSYLHAFPFEKIE